MRKLMGLCFVMLIGCMQGRTGLTGPSAGVSFVLRGNVVVTLDTLNGNLYEPLISIPVIGELDSIRDQDYPKTAIISCPVPIRALYDFATHDSVRVPADSLLSMNLSYTDSAANDGWHLKTITGNLLTFDTPFPTGCSYMVVFP